jgi:hypothetical protein
MDTHGSNPNEYAALNFHDDFGLLWFISHGCISLESSKMRLALQNQLFVAFIAESGLSVISPKG